MKRNKNGVRHAHHPKELKDKMIKRLNRIEGQIRGIAKMIDNDVYCDDILNQIASVESALNGVKQLLLEAHIKSCVVEQIQEGETEVIEELVKTIRKLM